VVAYRKFRRTIAQAGATDFDQVEWRFNDGLPTPVALFELTRVDGSMRVPDTYLQKIIDRFTARDWQGRFAIRGAELLGCEAWVVAFRWSLSEFWVYNLSKDDGWWHVDQARYKKWITNLGTSETGERHESRD